MSTELEYKDLPDANSISGRCIRIIKPCLVMLLSALVLDYTLNNGHFWFPILIMSFQVMFGSVIYSLIRGNRCPVHNCSLEVRMLCRALAIGATMSLVVSTPAALNTHSS